MKVFFAFFLLTFTTLSFADLAERHAQNCEDPEIKMVKGENGSCRVVIVPRKISKNGSCTGSFQGKFPCTVTFNATPNRTDMNLTCGKDPKKPFLNQDLEGETIGYTVTTLVKRSDAKEIVINDKNAYTFITNEAVDIHVVENELKKSAATMSLRLDDNQVELTNVDCR